MLFYIQDSDDVYGTFRFHPGEEQSIQSQPQGRFLSLGFLREGGALGEVSLGLSALYLPAGAGLDPALARDGVLNGSRSTSLRFSSGQTRAGLSLPIRNDAFLQNGARFLVQVGWGSRAGGVRGQERSLVCETACRCERSSPFSLPPPRPPFWF